MKKILVILIMGLLLIGCGDSEQIDLSGYYEGYIDVAGSHLEIQATLTQEDDLTGFIDIPSQGAFGLEITDVLQDSEKIAFQMFAGQSKVKFDGIYENETISGDFTQSGQVFSFELKKTEKVVDEDAYSLSVENGEITLTGEYLVPETEAEMPVVLIIAGSGPTDLNGNSMAGVSAQPYLLLAEALKDEGIASLRYNKRVVNNPVNEADISFDDFVDDAKFLTKLLLEDSRFNKVVLIGHSQGALIAEIVAAELEVDQVVLLAGAGNSIDKTLINQLSAQLSGDLLEASKSILSELKKGNTVEDVPSELASLFRPSIQGFFSSWIKYDPVEVLQTIDEEVLVVVGSVDLQTPITESELFLQGNKEVDFVVIDNMNHVLKETTADQAANFATYSNPDLPIHESLVEELIQFILK